MDESLPPLPAPATAQAGALIGSTVYVTWQKGFAWLSMILGLLATMILPPLLTATVWLILPDEVKSLINSLIGMGMMLLMMWLLMSVMKPLMAPEKEKPRQIKEKAA